MKFSFGVDQFQYCGWAIDDEETYNHIASLVKREGRSLF